MLQVRGLTKIYKSKKGQVVTALNSVNLDFADKGLVFLLGKSGSGKSTLLNLLGGLDKLTSGSIIIKGKSSDKFKSSDFDSYRNTFIGFIFQEFNILQDMTVGKNIGLALELQHKKANKASIESILNQVDLQGYYDRKPNELSGGQKQRVAIARALIKNPDIIMGDEPTGSLDSNTGRQVFETLKSLAQSKLVIVVSHDRENAELYGDRIIELKDGVVIADRTRAVNGVLQDTPPISIVREGLIHIKPKYQLQHKDVEYINNMLATATNDVYISADPKSNLEFDRQFLGSGGSTSFEPTSGNNLSIKQYQEKDFKLIHSKMPFKDSLKMGASGLKYKPIRLFFTIILALIAFSLFGFINTVASVNTRNVEYNTFKQNNYKLLTVSNDLVRMTNVYGYSEPNVYLKNKKDIEDITGNKALPIFDDLNISNYGYSERAIQLTENFEVTNLDNGYYDVFNDNGINKFIEISNTSQLGLVDATNNKRSALPTELLQVAITDWIADVMIAHGYVDSDREKQEVKTYDDLIGKAIGRVRQPNNDDAFYTISGVYKTDVDMRNYDDYKNMPFGRGLANQRINSLASTSVVGACFVMHDYRLVNAYKQFNTNNFEQQGYDFNPQDYAFSVANLPEQLSGIMGRQFRGYNLDNLKNMYGVDNDGNPNGFYFGQGKNAPLQLADNQVVLNANFFDEGLSLTQKKQFFDQMDKNIAYSKCMSFYMQNKNMKYSAMGDSVAFEIVGFYDAGSTGYDSYTFLTENSFSDIVKLVASSSNSIVVPLADNWNTNKDVFDYIYDKSDNVILADKFSCTLNVQTELSGTLRFLDNLIEIMTKVFLYVAIGFSVFAALLLMNFIGVSIANKKKEIGVLRAIGARSIDVFKIFLSEGMIIGLIVFVLSSIALFVTSILINNMVKMGLIVPGILQFGLMLGLIVGVIVLATYLPVSKIARKKPIDAINGK